MNMMTPTISKIVAHCKMLIDVVSKYKKQCFLMLGLLIIISYTMSWFWGGLNQDVVYYMNAVKLMTEGYIPYVDFDLGYTPLAFYLLYWPVSFFGTLLPVALSCSYIALFLDAVLVYKICWKYSDSQSLAIFGALSFLMMSRIYNSDDFYLEPFVLLSGLSSILLLFYKRTYCLVLSGILCFMSFWTKQYGLGFIFLVSAYIFVDTWFSRKGWLQVVFLWSGFVIGAFLFIGSMMIQGVELSQMFGLSGTSYQREGFHGLLLGFKSIFRWCCPLLVILPFSIKHFKQVMKDPFFVMSILGIGGFVLQTYVRAYGHYLILMSPFCVFALIYILKNTTNTKWAFPFKALCLIMVLSFIHRIGLFNDELYENRDTRTSLKIEALEMEKYIPRGSHNVYAYSADGKLLAYHLETLPPIENKKGLGLSFEGNKESLIESIKSSNYVIMNKIPCQDIYEILGKLFVKQQVGDFNIYIKRP